MGVREVSRLTGGVTVIVVWGYGVGGLPFFLCWGVVIREADARAKRVGSHYSAL